MELSVGWMVDDAIGAQEPRVPPDLPAVARGPWSYHVPVRPGRFCECGVLTAAIGVLVCCCAA